MSGLSGSGKEYGGETTSSATGSNSHPGCGAETSGWNWAVWAWWGRLHSRNDKRLMNVSCCWESCWQIRFQWFWMQSNRSLRMDAITSSASHQLPLQILHCCTNGSVARSLAEAHWWYCRCYRWLMERNKQHEPFTEDGTTLCETLDTSQPLEPQLLRYSVL